MKGQTDELRQIKGHRCIKTDERTVGWTETDERKRGG